MHLRRNFLAMIEKAGKPLILAMEVVEVPREPIKLRAVFSIAIVGLTGIMFGYDMGIVDAAQDPIRHYFFLSSGQLEVFVGLLSWCALPGALFGSAVAEHRGRRFGIRMAAAIFLVGNFAMALGQSFFMLMWGRAVAGFAMGMTYPIAPMYVAEVAPARLRGGCTALLEVLSNVGILLGYLIGWLCQSSWRGMLAFGLIPPLLLLLGAFGFMFESPRWLASQGKFVESQAVLNCLLGREEAQLAFDELSRHEPDDNSAGFVELLSIPAMRSTVLVGGMVAFFSQATGCETVIYYTGSILAQVGMARTSMLKATVIMGAVKTATVIASAVLVDRAGRKPLLLASALGMSFAMGTMSVAGAGMVQVMALCIFVMAFSLGFGPIVYTYNAEIYPQRYRAAGLGLAMAICRTMSAVISSTFLTLSNRLGTSGALALYSFIGFVAALFVALAVWETNGTVLERKRTSVPADDYGCSGT
eukprot:gnl/TRDRNA2_/TRDRNA2_193638_c0_seq1.p1 gnl/TRDRNA2_/TRDRNA2_193638_c0~~gnl/TRDRNA2_/TRDRNA2_193638_c0_seq1.p1  ORF type:complete len:473 (-),score=56.57 gnl/TRDRNA2_/TRDRNA2_193638_c0_seq1:194-1612(-)